tara:strand:+ start:214 stop:510 length:297 start_codon:yes stop_codon:yes gene_type:complete
MAATAEIGASEMIALADRGYYEGEQIRSCAQAGIIPMLPKPNTLPAQARGYWGKAMFLHEPDSCAMPRQSAASMKYRRPARTGQLLISPQRSPRRDPP